MHRTPRTRRAASSALALLLVTLAAFAASGCRGDERPNANGGAARSGATPGAAAGQQGATPADPAGLTAEIERLEREAERNPADEETRGELARLYVRRGNALRAAGQTREALADYQSALRYAPDYDEAQAGAAAANEQLGGEQQEDENGAPAPLPITPGVSDVAGQPTPTPKKP